MPRGIEQEPVEGGNQTVEDKAEGSKKQE